MLTPHFRNLISKQDIAQSTPPTLHWFWSNSHHTEWKYARYVSQKMQNFKDFFLKCSFKSCHCMRQLTLFQKHLRTFHITSPQTAIFKNTNTACCQNTAGGWQTVPKVVWLSAGYRWHQDSKPNKASWAKYSTCLIRKEHYETECRKLDLSCQSKKLHLGLHNDRLCVWKLQFIFNTRLVTCLVFSSSYKKKDWNWVTLHNGIFKLQWVQNILLCSSVCQFTNATQKEG